MERMKLPELRIGELVLRVPIIQGGMGVGISRSRLAGAVSAAGGLGVISTAQIGYDEPGFAQHPVETNLAAVKKHVRLAKEQAGGCPVGANIMVATRDYERYVRAAVEAGVDVILSGAGLPVNLPELVEGSRVKIAPIISSRKAADVMLRLWDRKYHRSADLLVVEGPLAGGHLGFSREQLEEFSGKSSPGEGFPEENGSGESSSGEGFSEENSSGKSSPGEGFSEAKFEQEIRAIIECRKPYEEKYGHPIPVVIAGGIFDYADICHALELGADGVQIASRFVAAEECDAAPAYRDAYLAAGPEDICIIDSPVGMPGRALRNAFVKELEAGKRPGVTEPCLSCVRTCKPAETPYCISRALIRAVQGDVEHGLVFCGGNTGRISRKTTVAELIGELCGEKAAAGGTL